MATHRPFSAMQKRFAFQVEVVTSSPDQEEVEEMFLKNQEISWTKNQLNMKGNKTAGEQFC